MPGPAHDGGEDSPGSIVPSKASLAHTGTVVYDQGSYLIVTHSGAERTLV